MAAFNIGLFFFLLVLLLAVLLVPQVVYCDDDEGSLLQGLNSYRSSLNLPALTKNDKADCLAEEIADDLEKKPCSSSVAVSAQSANYINHINKCKIDPNTTTDGVILPVCVPNLDPITLVLTNYTHSQHARYLNNSKYTGIGMGSEDDWMVVVLSTNNPSGSFASEAASLFSKAGLVYYSWMALLLWLLVPFVQY